MHSTFYFIYVWSGINIAVMFLRNFICPQAELVFFVCLFYFLLLVTFLWILRLKHNFQTTPVPSWFPKQTWCLETQSQDFQFGLLFLEMHWFYWVVSLHVKSPQSCPTLCDPMDCSPPGSSVHGVLQARTLVAMPPPGDLPDPGIEPAPLMSSSLADGFFRTSAIWDARVVSLPQPKRWYSLYIEYLLIPVC